MPAKKDKEEQYIIPRQEPATNPADRQQQMMAYADAVVEHQMLEGTVSAQVLTYYLKLSSDRERLEEEKLRNENLRLQAQVSQIESQQRTDQLMAEVLDAIKLYTGTDDDE